MERILEKYPDRVPLYVDKKEGSKVNDIPKHKFLVPKDMTIGNFVYILRKHIKLEPSQALFVFIDNKLVSNSEMIGTVYEQKKNNDKFLYVIYSIENTFG